MFTALVVGSAFLLLVFGLIWLANRRRKPKPRADGFQSASVGYATEVTKARTVTPQTLSSPTALGVDIERKPESTPVPRAQMGDGNKSRVSTPRPAVPTTSKRNSSPPASSSRSSSYDDPPSNSADWLYNPLNPLYAASPLNPANQDSYSSPSPSYDSGSSYSSPSSSDCGSSSSSSSYDSGSSSSSYDSGSSSSSDCGSSSSYDSGSSW